MDPNTGEEIIDWTIIASKYISSGQFLIDVLSTVPFNEIYIRLFDESLFILEVLQCLKLLRL